MNRTTTNNGFRQESQESGIGVPSYRRIGVTNPSNKRYNHKESGLQTPPTRDTPIPTRDTPIKESGLQTPPTEDNHTLPGKIHVDGGVSSLYPFLFLLLKQQKPGNLYVSQRPFRCMLFNNFNIYCLKNV